MNWFKKVFGGKSAPITPVIVAEAKVEAVVTPMTVAEAAPLKDKPQKKYGKLNKAPLKEFSGPSEPFAAAQENEDKEALRKISLRNMRRVMPDFNAALTANIAAVRNMNREGTDVHPSLIAHVESALTNEDIEKHALFKELQDICAQPENNVRLKHYQSEHRPYLHYFKVDITRPNQNNNKKTKAEPA